MLVYILHTRYSTGKHIYNTQIILIFNKTIEMGYSSELELADEDHKV